jgi:hypothetical protein
LEQLRSSRVPRAKFAFKRSAKSAKLGPEQPSTPTPPASARTVISDGNVNPDSSPVSASSLAVSRQTNRYLTADTLPSAHHPYGHSDLTISDLEGCIVNLLPRNTQTSDSEDHPADLKISAVQVRNIVNSVVILPSIGGSIMLQDLHRCTIMADCHQVHWLSSFLLIVRLISCPVPHAQLKQGRCVPLRLFTARPRELL